MRRLLTLLWFVAACAGSEHAEQVADADTTDALLDSAVVAAPIVFRAVHHTTVSGFPHAPHREQACQSCHQELPTHRTHGDVACNDCHPAGAEDVAARLPGAAECLACHHVERRDLRCTQCHQETEIAGRRLVTSAVHMAVWDPPRERALQFDHARHDTLACADCHESSETNAPERACRDCHAEHHVATADCTLCHQPEAIDLHEEVHAGCGAARCHTDAAVLRLPPTRFLCLTCHLDQREHEPDGDCATCHEIRNVWPAGGASP